MENALRVVTVCYCVVFELLTTAKGATAAKRHLLINVAGLIQPMY